MTEALVADVLVALALLAAGLVAHLLLVGAREVPRGVSPGDAAYAASGVSVVVPARDEEQTLPPLLTSLRGLRIGPAEVLVVDDGSDDRTAAVARDGGALVVPTPGSGPPPGWTGKAWACHRGATASGGSTLVFLDADTQLAPDALDGVLHLLEEHGGLVSVQPHHATRRPYEQLSAYFNLMSLLASGAFARRPPTTPMAFGPVLVTRRADYDRAGGHTVVRAEVLDDAKLAAAYVRNGMPVHCFLGGEAVVMRMYPGGLRQLVEGWTKNIASGAATADPRPALAAGLWLASHWAVAVGVALSVVALVSRLTHAGATSAQPALLLGHPLLWVVAWVGVSLQVRGLLRRAGSFRWWAWAVFPVPLLAFTLIFVRSVLLTAVRRQVTWRGRTVSTRTARSDGP